MPLDTDVPLFYKIIVQERDHLLLFANRRQNSHADWLPLMQYWSGVAWKDHDERWMTCDFTSFSTVFHSYQDDGGVDKMSPRAGIELGPPDQ